MTKQGFNMKKGLLIVAIFVGSLLSTGRADDMVRNSIEDKFRMALIEEETGQQLDTAIQAYKEVIAGLDDQRKMAVTAIYHLGECYRKQGKTNEAVAQFERILRDFSEQRVVVDLAQRRCAELYPGKNGKVADQGFGLTNSTETMTPEEAVEIQKLKAYVKDSPDLINVVDNVGETPLLKAATAGHLSVVKYLLSNGVGLNVRDRNGRTALHKASLFGHKSIVEFLLSQGADVNDRDNDGYTPLILAVNNGSKSVVQVLLGNKANVNAKDKWDATPLLLAVNKGFKSVVQVLLDNKADVNIYGLVDPNERRMNEAIPFYTPLHYSLMNGYLDITKLLLVNKADPNATNSLGQTPIFPAISTPKLNGKNDEAIELLLQYKADINFKCENAAPYLNGTPLHSAGVFDAKLSEFLISHGADVNATNGFGDTPLHTAVFQCANSAESRMMMIINDAIDPLLNHGAGINAQNNNGDTPLHIAFRYCQMPLHRSLVECLLNHKTDPNITNRAGKTPLMLSKEVSFPQGIPNPNGPQQIPNGPQQKVAELEKLLRKYGATDTPKKPE
jgi:ankyrin repeat protein